MKLKFDIAAQEFKIIKNILESALPANCTVWVFGSRVKNQAKFNSDLDLALDYKNKVALKTLLLLKEAFEESPLPYTVDVLDINDVSEKFQRVIRQQAIAFPLAKSDKVPKLRFPEFRGEWVKERFEKSTLSIKSGRSSYQESGEFPVYGSTDQIGFSEEFEFEQPAILVARVGANAGRINRAKGKYGVTDNTLAILLNKHTNFDFVVFLLEKTNLNRFVFGSGQPLITGTMLKRIKCTMPTLPEQQKIAAFLSAIDIKIEQVAQKKALLEDYKKGCMQKLFSQEQRFKDAQGNDFPDWVEKRLGDLGEIVTGKTPKTSDPSLWSGDIPFITPTDIDENKKYQRTTSRCISKTEKLRVLPSEAVLFTCIASIGKMCLSTEASITNQQINSLVVRRFDNAEFVYYALKQISPKIKAMQANTTLPIINKTEFSKFKVWLPILPEQQKIASFLSAIDTKIDLITTELKHIKTFKKGLLQQMFA